MIGSNVAAVLLARHPLGSVQLPPVRIFGMCRFRSDMRMLEALVPGAQERGLIKMLRGDLDDPHSVHRVVHRARPDVVFHLGAQAYNGVSWGAPALTLRTNVEGTAHLLE